jgi:lipoprotein-releasing system permease protein
MILSPCGRVRKMGTAYYIAKRFLLSNKAQTLFIILGIAVGVSVQVFVGCLIQGLQKSLVNRTVGNSSHVTVLPANASEKIEGYENIITEIDKIDGVSKIAAVQDVITLVFPGGTPINILLRGFELAKGNSIYKFLDNIYEGKAPAATNQVIIGKELQEELNIAVGNFINVSTSAFGPYYQLEVVGFFDLGIASLNKLWVIGDFNTANTLFDFQGKVSSISIQVADVFAADTIAAEIETKLNNPKIVVSNWKEENAQLLSGLNGQSYSSYLIQVFVIISVLLAIASVLAITVLQKSKQLGILKAMGIDDGTAAKIFLSEGFLLGLGGGIAGVLLGLGLLYMFTTFALGADGQPIIALYIDPNFILLSGLLATLASTLAALLPAKRSSKLSVIEVIRNG